MTMIILKVLFLLLPITNSTVIVDILKQKSINNLISFDCNEFKSKSLYHKMMNENGVRMSSLDIGNTTEDITIPPEYTRIALVFSTSCDGWSKVLDLLDHKNIFKRRFAWLVVTENISDTTNVLTEYPIEIDSDVTILHRVEENLYQLYEAYNTGFYTHGEFIVKRIGTWTVSQSYIRPNKRMDLSGVVLKTMVVITHRLMNETVLEYLAQSRKSSFDSLHKLKYFTILKYLRDMYNFSYAITRTNSWGYLYNESFDGMVGALQRREVDIGGSPVFFKSERAKVLDYVTETWKSRPCFFFIHPKRQGAFYKLFTMPLSDSVWYDMMALMTVSAFLLYLLLRLRAGCGGGDMSFSLSFLCIWGAVCQQGMSVSSSSASVKMVIFSVFVFTLTIYQYYNAVVVSTLLRELPKNIRTLEDLVNSNLKAGVEDVLYDIDFFKHTTNPQAIQLYKEKIVTEKFRNFFDAKTGMALVKTGGFAFHVNSVAGYRIMRGTFTEREVCAIQEIHLYPPQNVLAVVKKGSPYNKVIAYGIRKAREAGLMRRIESVWEEPKPDCVKTPDSSVFSVTIVEFSTPLLVLALGLVLSLVALMGEICFKRFEERRVRGRVIKFRWQGN